MGLAYLIKGGPFYISLGSSWCITLEVLTAALDRHKDRPDAVIAVPRIRTKEGSRTTLEGFLGVCGSDRIEKIGSQNFVEVWPWGGRNFL